MKGYLKQIQPVLPVQNVMTALFFYVGKLGFDLAFADDDTEPKYAGIRRDGIEIHLQWHDEKDWESVLNTPMLRIVTKDIEALFEEFQAKEVFHENTKLAETSWGTKEFAFYDIYKNGLTFYMEVSSVD